VAQQYPTLRPGKPPYRIVLEESAMRNDGSVFTDHDVHRMLRLNGIKNPEGEWYRCTAEQVRSAILAVRTDQLNEENRSLDFAMRPEQAAAVAKTAAYFKSWRSDKANRDKPPHFLWNAKMRFGKTFAAYQLAKRMGWKRILVLTFKPAVQSAWEEDLRCHVDFQGWQFISPDGLSYEDADKEGRSSASDRFRTIWAGIRAPVASRRKTSGSIRRTGLRDSGRIPLRCLAERAKELFEAEDETNVNSVKVMASIFTTKRSCQSRRVPISTCPARRSGPSLPESSLRSRSTTGPIPMSSGRSETGPGRTIHTPHCRAWCS
jgi:hypothetical protein